MHLYSKEEIKISKSGTVRVQRTHLCLPFGGPRFESRQSRYSYLFLWMVKTWPELASYCGSICVFYPVGGPGSNIELDILKKIEKSQRQSFLMGHFMPLISFFVFFNTFDSLYEVCRCLDSNFGSLVTEAIALPTVPQSLPKVFDSPHNSFVEWNGVAFFVGSAPDWLSNR